MTKTPVDDRWRSYRRLVVPADADPVQVEECRRAFFAGAASMFGIGRGVLTPEVDERTVREVVVAAVRELRGFRPRDYE